MATPEDGGTGKTDPETRIMLFSEYAELLVCTEMPFTGMMVVDAVTVLVAVVEVYSGLSVVEVVECAAPTNRLWLSA